MRRSRTVHHHRALLAGAATLIVGLLPAATGFAQSASIDHWRACLDDQAPTTANVAPGTSDTDPVLDEVILDFDDDLSDAEVKRLAKAHGLTVSLNSVAADAPNVYIAEVDEGAVPYIKDCLTKGPLAEHLEIVEENFEMSLLGMGTADADGGEDSSTRPNDPLYQFQWHFQQVGAEEAWKTSTGKDVVVSVIDTGVAVEDDADRGIKAARDLAGTKHVPGYDFVDKDDYVFDGHGHGTHVAGTIAQTTNNKYGVAGLAHGAKIMPMRVLNSRGFGQVADIADAIRWSADHGAHVINMSLGGPLPSLVMKRAIDHAYKKGVTVIAAAGNGGRRAPSYPAAYDHVVAVAATQFDRSTTFYSQWGSFVDIAAPGGNTRVDQNGDGRPDGVLQQTLKEGSLSEHDFLLYMGTSMASPHVAAGAAMVISQGITHPDKVEEVLQRSADTSEREKYDSDKEYTERYGAGIMRVDQAVQSAVLEQGSWRFGTGAGLLMLALLGLRRRETLLAAAPKLSVPLVGGAVLASSGLFFLPLLMGDATWVSMLSRPLAELDMLIFGLDWHQNPLMASALIPLGAYALMGHRPRLRMLACGLAIGMAGFCLSEAVLMTSDVRWIPGMDALDRVWLAGNGALSFAVGYLGLKSR